MSQPEPVENFDVSVEETDRGWIVVSTVDGVRKELGDPHPDQKSAEFYAENVSSAAERWEDCRQRRSASRDTLTRSGSVFSRGRRGNTGGACGLTRGP